MTPLSRRWNRQKWSSRSGRRPCPCRRAGEPEEQQGSSSSSGEESEDVVPAKSVVVPRPVAPPGTEMVRHVKLRTAHLAFEGFKRILVCGRAIGPDHEFNPEVRWDFARTNETGIEPLVFYTGRIAGKCEHVVFPERACL